MSLSTPMRTGAPLVAARAVRGAGRAPLAAARAAPARTVLRRSIVCFPPYGSGLRCFRPCHTETCQHLIGDLPGLDPARSFRVMRHPNSRLKPFHGECAVLFEEPVLHVETRAAELHKRAFNPHFIAKDARGEKVRARADQRNADNIIALQHRRLGKAEPLR